VVSKATKAGGKFEELHLVRVTFLILCMRLRSEHKTGFTFAQISKLTACGSVSNIIAIGQRYADSDLGLQKYSIDLQSYVAHGDEELTLRNK
jgi:hypothetical protein